jgi:hypothetical protein
MAQKSKCCSKNWKLFYTLLPNLGAIAIASNPIYHARTKCIEVDYHFIKEKILHKDLIASYISTQDQCADIFTKGLTPARFLFLIDKLMVTPPPISLKGAVKEGDQLSMKKTIRSSALATTSNGYFALRGHLMQSLECSSVVTSRHKLPTYCNSYFYIIMQTDNHSEIYLHSTTSLVVDCNKSSYCINDHR